MIPCYSLSLLILLCAALTTSLPVDYDATITTVAFGSCNRHNYPQPLWPHINTITHGRMHQAKQQQPHTAGDSIFVWLGDIVYADQHIGGLIRWPEHNATRLNETYNALKYHPQYTQLRNHVPIVGVYDDHDYGENDGNADYKMKILSQQVLLDFLDEPNNSSRRMQQGAYAEYTIGSEAGKRLQIILLDVRYHQDYKADNGAGDMLGYQQWNWLQSTLRSSQADLILIGGGIQFIATDKPVGESWKNMPIVRYRLMRLLSTVDKPVVLLSGDVHLAEFQRTFVCSPAEGTDSKNVRITPLIDMTSSGMTHAIGIQKPFGWLGLPLFNKILNYVTGKSVDEFFAGLNYGAIHIDWAHKQVTMDIHDVHNTVQLRQQHSFDALRTHTSADLLARTQQSNYTLPFANVSLPQIQAICNAEDQRVHKRVFNLSGIKTGILIIVLPVCAIITAVMLLTRWFRRASGHAKGREKVD